MPGGDTLELNVESRRPARDRRPNPRYIQSPDQEGPQTQPAPSSRRQRRAPAPLIPASSSQPAMSSDPTPASRDSPQLKWGRLSGLSAIKSVIASAYSAVIKWYSNFFVLPRGNVSKAFITELTRLLQLFTTDSLWKPLALQLVQVFVPIMLQKPSANSKTRDHRREIEKNERTVS